MDIPARHPGGTDARPADRHRAMSNWIPPETRAVVLAELDRRIAAEPDAVVPRFDRACLLASAGLIGAAKQEYLALLARAPDHAGALNNLGALFLAEGHRRAARLIYAEAVKYHPDDPMGRVNLANVLQALGETAAAQEEYQAVLALDPAHREAHRGLAQLLSGPGREAAAERHRELAFRGKPVTVLPYRGTAAPVPLLVLVSARDGNLAYETLVDEAVFETSVLVAEFFDAGASLPPHRLILNAIGEADLCGPALDRACEIVRRSAAPVVNRPDAVQATGRSGNAQRLAGLAGVRVPQILELPRGAVDAAHLAAAGFRYPLLLRAPGFHMGRHFVEVADPDALAASVAGLPGETLMAIEYLDARGRDGKARKYRVMIVEDGLYPLHLAISGDWKIHYFSADMTDRPEHRAEEAAFLADLPGSLGAEAAAALARIRDALELDYGGIDFGLSPEGELLLFEANATMIAALPPPDPIWDYRRGPAETVRAAARQMLRARAGVA
jgi:lipoprotein NlpI